MVTSNLALQEPRTTARNVSRWITAGCQPVTVLVTQQPSLDCNANPNDPACQNQQSQSSQGSTQSSSAPLTNLAPPRQQWWWTTVLLQNSAQGQQSTTNSSQGQQSTTNSSQGQQQGTCPDGSQPDANGNCPSATTATAATAINSD